MLRNRALRDRIDNAAVVEEISRWNDGGVDSLADLGISLSVPEERLQQDYLELMAIEERLAG